ncbi:arginine--tRNA ligase [Desulfovibrio litoralis]|nr:arginine--tRNA ligase [Desulfovibrio litoralis]
MRTYSYKDHLLLKLQELVANLGYNWSDKITLEAPKDEKFGDLALNIAMVLAKEAKQAPRTLATLFVEKIKEVEPEIENIDIAGPGFLNIKFKPSFWQSFIARVQAEKDGYGRSDYGRNRKFQVEFVSANPTGPLHIGHGRGAAVGDSLARVLRFSGFNVESEYYINDAGRQMRLLGTSVYVRILELAGKNPELPEDWYKGEYIIDLAKELLDKQPEILELERNKAEDLCFEYAKDSILAGIKQDLIDFRVFHDIWFSELSLVSSGAVKKALDELKTRDEAYEKDGALWFRSTKYGDEKDRVLVKNDGSLTYFASDIAYHHNKYERGFEFIVDVWGADHHGYIPRMKAAVEALGKPAESFDVVLVQLVNLLKNGEQIAMSTRAGKFETLADVLTEVGVDAARFMFLSRKSDSPLDFDMELVKQRTMENPVYYVQYAHARIKALFRKAEEKNFELQEIASPKYHAMLNDNDALSLLRRIAAWEEVACSAAKTLSPHHISHFLLDLAGATHSYYANNPILKTEDKDLILSRMSMLDAVRQVLANGLELLGVTAPESM